MVQGALVQVCSPMTFISFMFEDKHMRRVALFLVALALVCQIVSANPMPNIVRDIVEVGIVRQTAGGDVANMVAAKKIIENIEELEGNGSEAEEETVEQDMVELKPQAPDIEMPAAVSLRVKNEPELEGKVNKALNVRRLALFHERSAFGFEGDVAKNLIFSLCPDEGETRRLLEIRMSPISGAFSQRLAFVASNGTRTQKDKLSRQLLIFAHASENETSARLKKRMHEGSLDTNAIRDMLRKGMSVEEIVENI